MSNQVDNRVVSMQFDNQRFEKNVETSLNTLEKLKKSLKLDGATKGLEEVDRAADKVDMSSLSKAVETINSRFSSLGIMAVTALTNITNSAINAGKRMVSALAIDPIKTGFSEYETQINSVQTILANTESKGSTLQDVNNALAELNTYADKTIYNFTEMTRNIGTFTAAGVDLDTSVAAIKGIANLAAVSGSTSQQASTAMYQLSQAMSSGTVKLMDWNSVVNAGMGGQVFQDALKETARVHKINIDKMIEKEGSFRETLQNGWLTTDILTETLSKFTGDLSEKQLKEMGYTEEQIKAIVKMGQTANDAATKVKTFTQLFDTLKEAAQSGWTKTWEIIIGDFGEAKELLTEISDMFGGIIGESADKRNDLLSGALSTGWKQLLNEGITDAAGFEERVTEVAKKHGIDLSTMINDETTFQDTLKQGWMTSEILSESIAEYGNKLKGMSEAELEAAGYTMKDVQAFEELEKKLSEGKISLEEFTNLISRKSGRELLIESLRNALKGIVSVITPIKEGFREIFPATTAAQLYKIIESFKNFTSKLTLSETQSDYLKRTFKGLFAVLDIGIHIVKSAVSAVIDLVRHFKPAGDSFLSFNAGIGDFLVKLRDAIKSSGIFSTIFKGITSVLKAVTTVVFNLVKVFAGAFSVVADSAEKRLESLSFLGGGIQKAFSGLAAFVNKVAQVVGKALGGLMEKITSSIKDADYNSIFDMLNGGIFSAIGIFIAKFIKSGSSLLDKAGGFVDSIKGILDGVGDALNAFTESIKAKTLKTIATAIAILAASLFVLSIIDSEKLTTSLTAITALFIELFGAMSIFSKLSEGKGFKSVGKIARALRTLSVAVFILAVAMKIMSTMSWSEMGVGLISMTVGLGALIGAVHLLPKEAELKKATKAIKKLASSLVVFAIAMKIMSTMSWKEMGVGLITTVVGLGALVGAVHLLPKGNELNKASKAISTLSRSLLVFAIAMKIMSTMSWSEMARGLISTVVGLGALVATVRLLPKDAEQRIKGMMKLSVALVVMSASIKLLSSMSWDELARGLVSMVVGLGALVTAVNLMPKNASARIKGMLGLATAVLILGVALKTMGSMSWEGVAKSLVTLAGAFIIIGVAAAVFMRTGLIVVLPKLAGTMALFGAAVLLAGAGVLALAAGISMLVVALGGGAGVIIGFISSLIGLIPYIIEQIGVGIVNLCGVIAGAADAICEAVKVIILAVVDALVTCIPAIVDGILALIDELLASIVKYIPTIVRSIFDFLIALLNGIAEKLPELIQAGVNLVMAFFQGCIDALQSIDTKVLLDGIKAVGLISAVIAALAAVGALVPLAMIGVLGMFAVVTELAIVLSAIGALAQLPGLSWLVKNGGDFLQAIGTAIGQFLGGIIGGFAKGMSSALPQVGKDLSDFMTNVMPFVVLAKQVDSSTLDGVKSLVDIILALTAANVVDGLTSWFTGGSALPKFGKEIAEFGPYIKKYSDAVKGVDPAAVQASANAAKMLSELADNLPNSGGVVGWFAGENNIGEFGKQLIPFGQGMKKYSDSIAGFNPEAVVASANAAKALAEMADIIPNQGGMISWFAGDNSIASFGPQLPKLGKGLKEFSDSIAGLVPENISAAAEATKHLAELADIIPNEGGIVSWFTGDNSIASFGDDLPALGKGLKGFSDSIAGIVPDNISAAAAAAKALAEMADVIPNEGGMVSWFTGDNSIASFGPQLPILGEGLKGFSDSIAGIVPENIMAATAAAKSLAEMADVIPNEGGIVSWFTGDNSIASFGAQLPVLGEGLKGFSDSLEGMNAENVTAASVAAKHLADMTDHIPNEGGIASWFTGDNSIASFGAQLPLLGEGLKGFSDSIAGIVPENVSAAATAAKSLAEMTDHIPNEGGIVAWFTGESSIAAFGAQLPLLGEGLKGFSDALEGMNSENVKIGANATKTLAEITDIIPNEGGVTAWFSGESGVVKFADNLPVLGTGIKGFSDAITGIVPDNVTSAANAAKSLAEITKIVPNEGGIKAWFSGDSGFVTFIDNVPKLGKGLKSFSDAIKGIVPDNITAAAKAAKTLAEMAKTTPEKTDKITSFGTNLVEFGKKLKTYFSSAGAITPESIARSTGALDAIEAASSSMDNKKIESVSKAIEKLTTAITGLSKIKNGVADEFSTAIEKLGKTNIEALITAFEDAGPSLTEAVSGAITSSVNAIKTEDNESKFKSAGKYLIEGLAKGIKDNKSIATTAAQEVADAVESIIRSAWKINSPSKVFYKIALGIGEGIRYALGDSILGVKHSASDLADTATDGFSNVVSKIAEFVNSDMDTQPTIRPVLDLSDVRSGANTINGMFSGNRTLTISAPGVGAIAASMSARQNGNNDLVSAINKLAKSNNKSGDTYQINGINYSEGSDVADAIQTLVRAANIERRA